MSERKHSRYEWDTEITPLSNYDIIDLFEQEPRFGGVFAKDELPILETKVYVINLDNSDGPGTHWVCLSNIAEDHMFYFDSYGVGPPEEVLKWISKSRTHKKLRWNDFNIQELSTSSCGFFCCYVLRELLRGRRITSILVNDFASNLKANESLIDAVF